MQTWDKCDDTYKPTDIGARFEAITACNYTADIECTARIEARPETNKMLLSVN